MAMAADDVSNPWEQREGESGLWHSRFQQFYLSIGPNRSISDAYRRYRAGNRQAMDRQKKPPGTWTAAAVSNRWAARAALWDVYQGKLMVEAAERDAVEAHRRHVLMTRKHFNQVSLAGEKIRYDQVTDPLRWVSTFEKVLDMERRAHLSPIHEKALAKAELRGREDRQRGGAGRGVARGHRG